MVVLSEIRDVVLKAVALIFRGQAKRAASYGIEKGHA